MQRRLLRNGEEFQDRSRSVTAKNDGSEKMIRKKLVAAMAAAVTGMTMGTAFAHEGHDHGGITDETVSAAAPEKGETCPVSGEKVDAKGSIAYEYRGKVYRFCCASCLADFKKDPEKYLTRMGDGTVPAKEPTHR